jgi:hypothetical protein
MTMRAEVTRDSTPGKTDWGRPEALTLVEVGVIACRAWSTARRSQDDAGKSIVIEDMRANVPLTANVLERDRLTIRDRSGLLQFDGPVFVEVKQRKGGPGSRPTHYELMLTRHL